MGMGSLGWQPKRLLRKILLADISVSRYLIYHANIEIYAAENRHFPKG